MSEIARIAELLEQTFEGTPYYGPSILRTLEHVTAGIAARKPIPDAHSVWELVAHLTAEFNYARTVVEGSDPGPWIEGQTTWPPSLDMTEGAWRQLIREMKEAHADVVRAVRSLDDSMLDKNPQRVPGPFRVMLCGTLMHSVYHAGQIALLTQHMRKLAT